MTNTLTCGNNVEILKKVESSSVDLVLTSPPYDNIRTYKSEVKLDEKYNNYSFDFESIHYQYFL